MPFDILSHILRLKDNIFSIWLRFIHKLSKTGSIYVNVCTCVIKGYLDTQVNQWLETDLNCKYFETYLQCYVYVFISLLRIVNFFKSYIVYIENSQIFPVPPSSAVSFSHFLSKVNCTILRHQCHMDFFICLYLSSFLFQFKKCGFYIYCDFCIHNLTHSCAIHNEP